MIRIPSVFIHTFPDCNVGEVINSVMVIIVELHVLLCITQSLPVNTQTCLFVYLECRYSVSCIYFYFIQRRSYIDFKNNSDIARRTIRNSVRELASRWL